MHALSFFKNLSTYLIEILKKKASDEILVVEKTELFEEETIRIYMDAVHNIGIPKEKLDFEQLLKLICFTIADGKTGN